MIDDQDPTHAFLNEMGDNSEMSDAKTLNVSDERIHQLSERNNKIFFQIRFNFMNDHLGPRPGMIHLIFGTAGSGKTTLMNAIQGDCAVNHKILLWKSEEDVDDVIVSTSKSAWPSRIRKNIEIISEEDMTEEILYDVDKYKKYMLEQIQLIRPKAVFFDNITTSNLYESLNPSGQTKFFLWLKRTFKKLGIPLFLVGHTKTGVYDGQPHLIDLDDIRGVKTVSNGSPYVYIMQRFKINGVYYPFVNLRKSRFHQVNGFYHLNFSLEKNAYLGDSKVDFLKFKEYFGKRERL